MVTMRGTRIRVRPLATWVAGCLVLGALLLAPPAARGDATKALDAKARSQRKSELRNVAGTWITHRQKFPSVCPLCQGKKKAVVRIGRRLVLRDCPQCKAQGMWLSPKDYRAIYFDMKTQAFQQLPDIKDFLENQYKAASRGSPWPTRIARYRIRNWELVDDTHGFVGFLFDDATAPTYTFWIWSTAEKSKGEWCVYDSRSDGPWPQAGASEETSAGGTTSGWEPIGSAGAASLHAAAAGAKVSFYAAEFDRQADALRVRLTPRDPSAGGDVSATIAGDALRLLPRLLEVGKEWRRVETEWWTPWRNVDGDVRLKVTWTASLDRTAYASGEWSSSSNERRMALVTWQPADNPGWQLVGVATAPVAAPVARGGAAPESSSPPAAEPEAAAPAEPAESPPRAAAPPPPPAAAEPVDRGPAPTATPAAKANAEKGIAHMKQLFEKARVAHDEGVAAHQAGARDLWQEKLREARGHLGEIETVWREEVVSAMPGRDEEEKDQVANENFGAIWNEIYQLKGMVRKMSTL